MIRLSPVVMRERIRISVSVREQVQATVYKPGRTAVGVLLVHPATATPQGFYRGFAEYAAAAGMVVITYDYLGTGLSGPARGYMETRMRDWIRRDIPAVSRWAAHTYPELPHYAVGHSVGGHGLALNYGTEALTRAVIVSSHLANLRSIESFGERLRVRVLLHWLGPTLSQILGYMPGKRLGLGEDIPAAAMFEWGAWNRKPNYFFDDPTMDAARRCEQLRLPVLVIGAADDPWANPSAMGIFASKLVGAQVQQRTVNPEEIGKPGIGHHGLLRRGIGEAVWEQLLRWLRTGELE